MPPDKRRFLWAAVKYAVLTVAGFLLFRLCSVLAWRERGYFAVGAEAFALLLPLVYYVCSSVIVGLVQIARQSPEEFQEFCSDVRKEGGNTKPCTYASPHGNFSSSFSSKPAKDRKETPKT